MQLRGVISGHVAPLDHRAEGSAAESVLLSLGQYHRDTFSDWPVFSLWKSWAISLLLSDLLMR